jgi:hypothetical protein
MFVYRNPTMDQRRSISRQYDNSSRVIDWSKFGDASDDGGLAFHEEHYDVYSDDAKQNNYHTKSVLDATIASFLLQRPWLAANRASFVQSDNAGNYRDPITEIDLKCVGTRCFSEAGMGKDEGDGNGAVIKGRIRRVRDEGNGIEEAADLLEIGAGTGISGQTHATLNINRSNEDGGVIGRKPFCRNYALWTVDDTHITFWESVDAEASQLSISNGNSAVGFGPGIKQTLAEFDEKQRSQRAPTGATLTHADGTDTANPNPRQRASKTEKKIRKEKKEAEVEEKAAVKEAEMEAKKELLAVAAAEKARVGNGVDVCPRCDQRFLCKGWFDRHRRRWCRNRSAWQQSRRQQRDVKTRLENADALLLQEYRDRIASVGTLVLKLKAPATASAALGLSLVAEDGLFVVDDVSDLAEATAEVACGFVVEGFVLGAAASVLVDSVEGG